MCLLHNLPSSQVFSLQCQYMPISRRKKLNLDLWNETNVQASFQYLVILFILSQSNSMLNNILLYVNLKCLYYKCVFNIFCKMSQFGIGFLLKISKLLVRTARNVWLLIGFKNVINKDENISFIQLCHCC